MAEGQNPKIIEQNSRFTAKTKDGQDVEFEATLKFFIKPSGAVSVSVPGGQAPGGQATGGQAPGGQAPGSPQVRVSSSSESSSSGNLQPDSSPRGSPSQGQIRVGVQPGGDQPPSGGANKRPLTDEPTKKAFPRGPEESGECTMRQFIPDPCRAVDDAVRSIKNIYHNWFSGPRCPPPENTDNLNAANIKLFEKSKEDYSGKPAEVKVQELFKPAEVMGEIAGGDVMDNEEKYDM